MLISSGARPSFLQTATSSSAENTKSSSLLSKMKEAVTQTSEPAPSEPVATETMKVEAVAKMEPAAKPAAAPKPVAVETSAPAVEAAETPEAGSDDMAIARAQAERVRTETMRSEMIGSILKASEEPVVPKVSSERAEAAYGAAKGAEGAKAA